MNNTLYTLTLISSLLLSSSLLSNNLFPKASRGYAPGSDCTSLDRSFRLNYEFVYLEKFFEITPSLSNPGREQLESVLNKSSQQENTPFASALKNLNARQSFWKKMIE